MLDIILDCISVFIIIQLLYGVFFVGQLVTERFIYKTIPAVAEAWIRYKEPHLFK